MALRTAADAARQAAATCVLSTAAGLYTAAFLVCCLHAAAAGTCSGAGMAHEVEGGARWVEAGWGRGGGDGWEGKGG